MLPINQCETQVQKLALHYAHALKDHYALNVFTGRRDIYTPNEAKHICHCFWDMTDLAAEDVLKQTQVDGIDNIENAMSALFNLTYGYYQRLGYIEIWRQATDSYNLS